MGKDGAPLEEMGVAVLPGIVVGIFTVGSLGGAPGGAIIGGMVGAETYTATKKIEGSMLEILTHDSLCLIMNGYK